MDASEDDAYIAGLDKFGPDCGQVVAVVREPAVVMLSALTTFDL